MKKQIDLSLLSTVAGGILFHFIFWKERLALNMLLYSIFILLLLLVDPKIVKSKKMILSGGAHLLGALLVVFNNSILTVITWYISLAVFIGFAYLPALRSIIFAIIASILQLCTVPVNLVKRVMKIKILTITIKPFFRLIKYLVIPLLLIVVFSTLYCLANEQFALYVNNFFSNISTLFENIFNFFFADISFLRFLHFILGILLTGALFIFYENESLLQLETSFVDKLFRRRRLKKNKTVSAGTLMPPQPGVQRLRMGLKTESIIGIISFAALNLLILCLNLIDITTLWLAGSGPSNISYSAELHEGTNVLIWSIVLAMTVILYFFRGNLNFYSKNKAIRTLSYIWMLQNTFLIVSVFLRDYNYIDINGLTYKRIGVLIFLLLCIVGLITVFLKVKQQKTLFFLLKINGLSCYCLLLLFGFINWDVFISTYNIDKKRPIATHIEHYWEMSDKTIPLLDNNQALLKNLITTTNSSPAISIAQIAELDELINFRIKRFKQKQSETTWLSWNYRDWQTHRYLESKTAIANIEP